MYELDVGDKLSKGYQVRGLKLKVGTLPGRK